MSPRTSPLRNTLTLAAVLSSGLALAAPGGISIEQVTVQDGNWEDPATWDLGVVPTDHLDGSIAYLKHEISLSTSGAVTTLFVGVGGATSSLYLQGTDFTCGDASVGRSAGGYLEQRSGTSHFETYILVGSAQPGTVALVGGDMTAGNAYVGGLPTQTSASWGSLQLQGNGATLTVDQELVVSDISVIEVSPSSGGEEGLTAIQTGSAEFEPGSSLFLLPEFGMEVGDGWDVVVSSTPIVGLPEVVVFPPFEAALDTSDPNVLRVVITESPFPIWTDLGGGSAGVNGVPTLVEATPFPLSEGAPTGLTLTNAPASAPTLLLGSFSSTPLNILGGTLHANPWTVELFQFTDAQGGISFLIDWPAGIDGGIDLWVQYLCADGTVPGGLTLSNGLTATTSD